MTFLVGGKYNALVQDIVGETMRGVGSGRDTANKELIAQKSITWSSTSNSAPLSALQWLAMAVESCCLRTPAPRQDNQ